MASKLIAMASNLPVVAPCSVRSDARCSVRSFLLLVCMARSYVRSFLLLGMLFLDLESCGGLSFSLSCMALASDKRHGEVWSFLQKLLERCDKRSVTRAG